MLHVVCTAEGKERPEIGREKEGKNLIQNVNLSSSLVDLTLYGISLAIKSVSILSTSVKGGIFAPSSLNIHLC